MLEAGSTKQVLRFAHHYTGVVDKIVEAILAEDDSHWFDGLDDRVCISDIQLNDVHRVAERLESVCLLRRAARSDNDVRGIGGEMLDE